MELHMPHFGKVKWRGYGIRVFESEWDVFRLFPIVPYFWDTNINLDIIVDASKETRQTLGTSLKYEWELLDLDDRVVRNGKGNYTPVAGQFMSWRKHNAIKIGYLKPQQCYRLEITLTDIYGSTSAPLQIATFTIKDRDELYMQLFVALIGIIIGIILGFVIRGSL
jgi:hypothetical protein